jgi:hypothetical protein
MEGISVPSFRGVQELNSRPVWSNKKYFNGKAFTEDRMHADSMGRCRLKFGKVDAV